MMYQMKKLPYNYIPDLGLQILELPYMDEELSMFVLLPEEAADGSDPLPKVYNLETTTSKHKTVCLTYFSLRALICCLIICIQFYLTKYGCFRCRVSGVVFRLKHLQSQFIKCFI